MSQPSSSPGVGLALLFTESQTKTTVTSGHNLRLGFYKPVSLTFFSDLKSLCKIPALLVVTIGVQGLSNPIGPLWGKAN